MESHKIDWICTEIDDFIRDTDTTRWIVQLCNGDTVYQDDERPGFDLTAWERLVNHCKHSGLYIVGMKLQFRSHIEVIEPNADGYFFRKSILGSLGKPGDKRPPDVHYYLVGVLKDDILTVSKWRVPELIVEGVEERDPNCPRLVGDSIIKR